MAKCIDLTGLKFGRWTALYRDGSTPSGSARYMCKCDCGTYKLVNSSQLRNGTSNSCGCLLKDKLRERNLKHGLKNTKLYRIWHGMKVRCNNVNDKHYKNYGARGITVCDEWQSDFLNFYNWAMSNGYADNLSIDRINNNGNYEPSNCRWADKKTQSNNTRTNFYITYDNKTLTATQWSAIVNIKAPTILRRIKSGWSVDDALTKPVETKFNHGK